VPVPPGATSVSFQIKTLSVTASQSVQISVGPGCPLVTVSLTVNPNPTPGNNNTTPPATGGTPSVGSSPPGQSKQFQIQFQGWSTQTIPIGYLRTMRFQITNVGSTAASSVSVGSDNGYNQEQAPFSLAAGQSVVITLSTLLSSPSCNNGPQGLPVALTIKSSNLPSQTEHQVLPAPPNTPGC
jgi:hypothetical protein